MNSIKTIYLLICFILNNIYFAFGEVGLVSHFLHGTNFKVD